MKFVFLAVCLFFQNFCYASINTIEIIKNEGSETIIGHTVAAGSFFGFVDSGLDCLETIESQIPKPIKIVGDVGISLYSYTLTPLKRVLFAMSPRAKITCAISNSIIKLITETEFLQEKLIDKIDQEIKDLTHDISRNKDSRIFSKKFDSTLKKLNNETKQENSQCSEIEIYLLKNHEQFAKTMGETIIGVPIFMIIGMLLNKTWSHIKPQVLHFLSKNNIKNSKDWIIILETIMTSRVCFLPVQLHKQKQAIKNVFGIAA